MTAPALLRIGLLGPLLVALGATAADDAAPGVGAAAPAPEAVLADLPFLPWDEPNRVIVDLSPDGQKPFPLMLDTGAAGSVLTPRLARSLGVRVRRTKSSPYRKATVLGRDLQFWVDTRRGDTASNVAFEYGLLGSDFLDDYVLELDFPGRRVRFLDPQRYEFPESVTAHGEAVVPIRRIGTRLAVEIELNGESGWVMLDTGAPGTLIASGQLAESLGIDVDALPKHGRVQGTAGPVDVRFLETDSFRLGGFAFGAMPILVAPRGFYNIGGPTDSLVGYDVLSQFTLRIDFGRGRMWLGRSGDPAITLYGADYALSKRIGALLIPGDSGYAVWDVVPAGAAAAFGLRDGDQIVAPVGAAKPSIDSVLERIEKREELTVARRDGRVVVDLILPDPTVD